MSSMQSQEFTSSGTWNVPAGVSAAWITMIGGGGAGATVNPGQGPNGGGGGGSGEIVFCRAIHVTPNGTLTITVGAGGVAQAPTSTNGGATLVDAFGCLGGSHGSASNAGVGAGIYGGDNNISPGGNGFFALSTGPTTNSEEVRIFNGGSGGRGGAVGTSPFTGGNGAEAQGYGFAGGGSGDATSAGGGSGASSMWGNGGRGGNLVSPIGETPPDATNYGSGGGGPSGPAGGVGLQLGAAGAPGYALVQWIG